MPGRIVHDIQAQFTQFINNLPESKENEDLAEISQKLKLLAESSDYQERLRAATVALSEAASSILDLDELLKVSADLIQRHFNFSYVGIFLVGETKPWVELVAQTDQAAKISELKRRKLQDDADIAWVINHQQVRLSASDPQADQDLPTTPPEIIIPLINRGQVIGALVVQSVELFTLSEQAVPSLELLGYQLASAIQNVIVFAHADQQLEQLVTLHEVNLQIGSHLNLETLLEDVTKLGAKLLNVDSCIVRLFDESHQSLQIKAAYNPPDQLESNRTFGAGLSRVVIQHQQAVLANHWSEHALATDCYPPTHTSPPVLAILNVPLTLQNKVLGTLEVLSFSNPAAFDDNDLYALSLLASQAAMAIENTQLFSKLESNQHFLKAVIEHIPDPIFLKDKNHIWVEMNQANAAVIGRPEEELIGKTDKDYFSPELAQEFYRRDEEVLQTNQILQYEDTTIWGDGQRHTAYTRLIPLAQASGQPDYILGITHDITERKAHEVERERFLTETAALYRGSQAISRALSDRQIFEALFVQIRYEDPCEINAYLFDMVGNEALWAQLKHSWHKNKQSSYRPGSKFFLPEMAQARLLTAGEPFFIEDVATDSRLLAPERESLAPSGAKSIAVLPLTSTGQFLGAVMVYFTRSCNFSEVTRRFWLAMVEQAGVALSNRQLVQEAAYRAVQIETAAEVARAASSLLDLDELLNAAAALIQDRFHLYYVGVFLADEKREWAELRAGTGEAGQLQLQKKHRLKIGGESMIGWSIHHRQPRIALDVGKEAVRFQNPYLPDTRSEMALPLIYHHEAIGALTIQSAEPAAFSREDIIFLQTMADQLANAIINARLYARAQQDISDRKRAEEEMRTSEAQYRQLVQSANSIIFRMDPQGRITFFNQFAQEFFGYTEAELLGRNVVGTIVPEVDTAGHNLAKMITDLLRHPEIYSSNENENIRHNGERVWVSWANKAVLDKGGRIVEILCIGNDVTERKRAEEEILRRNEELAFLNRVSLSVTSTLDLASLLKNVAREIVCFFKIRNCGIALFDAAKTELTVIADHSSSETEPSATGTTIPVANNPSTEHVIETGQSLVVSQAQTNPLTKPIHELMRQRRTQCLMLVPLRIAGEVIGTIGLDTIETDREFTPAEVRLAETIAGQVAGAVANARMFEQTQAALDEREAAEQALAKRERYLATQLEIQNLLLASTGQELPSKQILKLLGEVSLVSRVYLFENHLDALGRLSTSQKDEWCAEGIPASMADSRFQNLAYADFLSRWANELARGNVISGRVADFPENERTLLETRKAKAILVLPLTMKGEFFGFIGFDNCFEARPWELSEIGLLRATTAAISLWYERQRAEESLITALQRTESLYRIGDTMATATDPQVAFETILGEYLRLLNLKWGVLALLYEADSVNKVQALYLDGQPVRLDLAIPATQPLFEYLVKTPRPFTLGDVYTHPLTADNAMMRQHLQAHSMLYLPIVLRGKVIGLIAAGTPEKEYRFPQNDIETGQVIADQLAIWLDNRQLLAEAQHRSEQLQTAAGISRAASSILDVDELINTSVNLIRDQFDFYYVGLFLVDETNDWAVLRAGTGEAGKIQLEMKHRLKIGGESMIGWSVQHRRARIALDVGQEAVRFQNPILPETHSEMALPLISREAVIGALTVQSTVRGAFSDEDVTLLQTMADQLANAIANARLFETVARAQREGESRLRETQALQQLSQELAGTLEIDQILNIFFRACTEEIGFEYVMVALVDKGQHRVKAIAGYGVTESNIKRANRSLSSNDILADIIRTGKTEVITGWDERFDRETFEAEGHEEWIRIFTPVTLRQENIGLVEAGFNRRIQATIQNIQLNIQPAIQDYQIRLLQAFINQAALALDNAFRYQASQRAARREALIKEITTKVRASTNLEDILQTTIKEVGQAISSQRTYVYLVTPEEAKQHPKINGKMERSAK